MPTWTVVYAIAFWPLLLALWAASLSFGDETARHAASAFAVTTMLEWITTSSSGWLHLEIGPALLDAVLFGLLMALTIQSARWWLAGLAALQLLAVSGHLAKALDPSLSRLTYAILAGGGGYPMMTLVAIGIYQSHRSALTSLPASDTLDVTRTRSDDLPRKRSTKPE